MIEEELAGIQQHPEHVLVRLFLRTRGLHVGQVRRRLAHGQPPSRVAGQAERRFNLLADEAAQLVTSLGRQRLSGERPEQYLAVWQKKAERHLANPLIYIGRYTEFIIRRCFLPYALLVLAVLNCLPATLRLSAIGANIAWIISLRSHITFSAKRSNATPLSTSTPSATEPLTV